MLTKYMRSTGVAAGFAALLLVSACATKDTAANEPKDGSDLVHVTNSTSVTPAPGPALIDSTGNVYSSSSAPGGGGSTSTGTNTNVNVVPERGTVQVRESALVTTTPVDQTIDTTATIETTETMRTETPAPVETTRTTTIETEDEPAPTRKRMRKD